MIISTWTATCRQVLAHRTHPRIQFLVLQVTQSDTENEFLTLYTEKPGTPINIVTAPIPTTSSSVPNYSNFYNEKNSNSGSFLGSGRTPPSSSKVDITVSRTPPKSPLTARLKEQIQKPVTLRFERHETLCQFINFNFL